MRSIFITILISLLSCSMAEARRPNMAKVPRETFVSEEADGPWFIFMDLAILLDGFFGMGRYEPREEECVSTGKSSTTTTETVSNIVEQPTGK